MPAPKLTIVQFLLSRPALAQGTAEEVATTLNTPALISKQDYWVTYNQLIVDFGMDAARAVAALMDTLAQVDPLLAKMNATMSVGGVNVALDVTQAQFAAIAAGLPADHPVKALLPQIAAKGQTRKSPAEQHEWGTVTAQQVTDARTVVANMRTLMQGVQRAQQALLGGSSLAEAIAVIA